MKSAPDRSRRVLFSCLGLIAAAPSFAQSAATAAAKREEAVQLSAFEVSDKASRGYVTTSALSASRIAVPITELSASVIVINEKLIDDTMAVQLRDTVNLVSGVTHANSGTGSQEQNSISMRGYTLSGTQRDGVPDVLVTSSGGFDYSLFERMEIVKGPAGVLYGTHSPGGIVNLVSKRPLAKPRTKISASGGSYHARRFDLDHSGLAGPGGKFGYRVALAIADTDGPNGYNFEPRGGLVSLNPSLSYRFDPTLQVWAWGARVRDNLNRTMPTVHAFATTTTTNPLTGVPSTGRALLSAQTNSNVIRNDTKVDTDSWELGATKSLKLGAVAVDARVLYRNFDQLSVADRIRGNAGVFGVTSDEVLDAAGNRLGVDTRLIQYDVAAARMAAMTRPIIRYDQRPSTTEGDNWAFDLNFAFNLGPTQHRLLGYYTIDDSKINSVSNTYDIRALPVLTSLGIPVVGGTPRLPLWPTRPITITRAQVLQLAETRALTNTVITDGTTKSWGVVERLSFWENRAILNAGARHTELDIATTNITPLGVSTSAGTVTKKNTANYGALVKVFKDAKSEASLFYNDNETFTPVFTIDRRLGATFGTRYPDRLATNREVGLKLDFLQSRVVATVANFKTTETNVLLALPDVTGTITGVINQQYQVPAGMRSTKGWELDVNVAPMPGWEFIASCADVDPKLENGQFATAVPFSTAACSGRYEFQSGALKNFSAMWLWTKWGDWSLGSRTYWIMPGGDSHTAILGYRWKNWNVRLRIENVLDRIKLLPGDFETAVGLTRGRNHRLGVTWTY